MAKVNMIIPDSFLTEIDCRAKKLNVNRTAFILMSLSQKFQQDDLMQRMPEMLAKIDALEHASSRLASVGRGAPTAQTRTETPKD